MMHTLAAPVRPRTLRAGVLGALLLLAAVASPQSTVRRALAPGTSVEQRAALALGVAAEDVTLVPLDLPLEPGETLEFVLPLEGAPRAIRLARHDLRAPGFVVLVWSDDGRLTPMAVPPASTYRSVDDIRDGLTSTASSGPWGLSAELRRDDGARWALRPLAEALPGVGRSLHALVRGGVPEPDWPACASESPGLPEAVEHADASAGFGARQAPPVPGALSGKGLGTGDGGSEVPSGGGTGPVGGIPGLGTAPGAGLPGAAGLGGLGARAGGPLGTPAPPHGCARRAQIAFDADYEYYQAQGSSVAATVARIESHLVEVDFFYQRDLRVSYELTAIVVRSAPFYAPTGGGDLLDDFRAEWNSTLAAVPRDLAHLMTGKPGSLIEFGGLAWVGVVCNLGLAYGWSMDSAGIVGHEVGHNWGAGHCHDSSPCNNMCGACLSIAPITKGVMEAYIAGVSCLDAVLVPTTPLPPYVVGESLAVAKDDYFAVLQPLQFDVLANDEDGNCQPPLLQGVAPSSALGGALAVLPGAGPKGRDLLSYTAPDDLFVGLDQLDYTVGDGTGQQTPGSVSVEVLPLRLSGWWPLDDGTGSVVADLGEFQRYGTALGAPAWVPSSLGGALEFDGVDDQIDLPAFNLVRPEITITCWARRDGVQFAFAGLLMNRDAGTQAGLHLGTHHELRYTWRNELGTFFWDSGLELSDGQWTFCALSVEPTQARLYRGVAGVLASATRVAPHALEPFAGTSQVGADPLQPSRRFAGTLDDVRVYDHALSEAELTDLFERGGRAHLPVPTDGGGLVDPDASLRWTAGLSATAHDVYLGTGYTAVRDADHAAPEYQGSLTGSSFGPGGLTAGSRWYWRVDELTPAGVVIGPVWQFRVDAAGHWRLDETSGTTAVDAHGLHDGVYGNGILLDRAPATPFTGASVRLHGNSPEEIVMPAPAVSTDRATITAWVRRIGDQIDWAGIVFCRGGDTVAGLNVGTDNELRYHWDGGQWDWDSGLVLPDATWAFCALVVEPTRATLSMGIDGAPLQTAVHEVGHGAEPFDAPLHLGHDPAGGRWFDGRLDDVRLFDRALSPAEIQRLYDDALFGTG